MLETFLRGDYAAQPMDLPVMILALCLAFLGGHVIAWTYMATHSGLSYSRTFVNAMIVLPMIVTSVMMVLSNNLVTAFGLMAVFAIVRFRNILRDTLDTTYILAGIVVGMACGTHRFPAAVITCVMVSVVLLYLSLTMFGARHRYDIIVNLHWARSLKELPELKRLLDRHSRQTHCASQRTSEGYEGADLSYRLLLRNPEREQDLLTELKAMEGVSRVTSMKAEDESEI
ncbi:DUF4956 domain-containing protein [Fontisphaera persica]|uniref:DUF4956 domain-containing protein n=1 Tax=Fontisphaera persica TaxID=2974023 RepID=UPI0024C0CC45|nr:DUF4956 domain-containing protein [Fontisphaera persica]WCJ57983.1 DUF4956 domain-containing protein [Fontisphaera persica]